MTEGQKGTFSGSGGGKEAEARTVKLSFYNVRVGRAVGTSFDTPKITEEQKGAAECCPGTQHLLHHRQKKLAQNPNTKTDFFLYHEI